MLKRLNKEHPQWKWIAGVIGVFVVIQVLISTQLLTSYWATILQRACYMAIVSLGLNLIYGFNGQFSLGQWGFYAIGAYAGADISYRWVRGDMAGLAVVAATLVLGIAAMAVWGKGLARRIGLGVIGAVCCGLDRALDCQRHCQSLGVPGEYL